MKLKQSKHYVWLSLPAKYSEKSQLSVSQNILAVHKGGLKHR